MTQPPAGVPPRQPVRRPPAPRAVNAATIVLMVSALIWLVVFLGDASAAQVPGAPPPTMVYLSIIYIILILFAWAGRDTRPGLIVILVLFAVFFVGIPLWAVMEGGGATLGGELLALASVVLFASAVVGVWMLYMPEAKAYFADSRAFRMAVKTIRRRRR